ncbi:MAG: protoporphyrinogen oxidase [Chloroflexota bacterium]
MNSQRKRVAIIGGGITGLAAAYRLQAESRRQHMPLDIALLERDARLGGKIFTLHDDHCVIEGGPDSFLAAKPQAIQLCEELGIADRLLGTNDAQKRTYIYSRGRLHDLPEGLSGLVPSRLSPMMQSSLISPLAKARLLLEFVLPAKRANGDESVAHFIARRLGHETFERLIEPLMGGIYAGDASRLSRDATFPQLRQLELSHGSLLRGVMKRPPANTHQHWTGFVSLRGGMQDLVSALQQRLRIDLQCGRHVHAVERASHALVIQTDTGPLVADAVVITTPAYVTAELLQEFDATLADAHRAIPHVSTATVSLVFQRAALMRPLLGFGFVIPSVERRRILACTWSSNKFPYRAPDELVLLRCFIGRAGQEQWLERDDHALIQIARDELKDILQIEAEPLFTRIFRWPRGMPQYNLGHLERVAQIEAGLKKHPGLFLAGAAYRGVGIPDCIRSANDAAIASLQFLSNDEHA